MDKPVSILINDFRGSLEKCINEAKLPPAVIEPIIKDYYMQVQGLARQQLMNDIRASQNSKDAKEENVKKEADN